MKLTRENSEQMEEGIRLVLSRWRELRDAVEWSMGGPHSRELAGALTNEVVDFFFYRESPTIYDLDDLLEDKMDEYFSLTEASTEEVAGILMEMYEECLQNNYQRIQKLRDTAHIIQTPAPPKKAASIRATVAEDKRGSSIIASTSESLPDDQELWITVSSKKSKRRKIQA